MSAVKFLGASVRGANSTLGWGVGQTSTLTVQLVEDSNDGDSFSPPDVGTPVTFALGSLSFAGLLQRWQRQRDASANPSYEVTVVDPREILDGCQVVLANYSGTVGTTRNLLNVYGLWEGQGFGLSYANDAGIPWSRVRDGVLGLVNSGTYGTYGGPLTYRGYAYGLDLSQLPEPSASYRMGGVSASLLELIAQICDDGAADFFVELVGNVIRVRTARRRDQPPLGTITAITSANYGGTVIRSGSGLESRNETTSSFLVGGEVHTLHLTDAIASFWGYDLLGSPILGVAARANLADSRFTCQFDAPLDLLGVFGRFDNWLTAPGLKWPEVPCYLLTATGEIIGLTAYSAFLGDYTLLRGCFGTTPTTHYSGEPCVLLYHSLVCDHMTLNASPVADVIGSVAYATSELELRLARSNFTSWAAFVRHFRPAVADYIGLTSPFLNQGVAGAMRKPDVVDDRPLNAQLLAINAVEGDLHARQVRLYEFIRGYADEYMGRAYAVSLPFLLSKTDPETLKVTFSYEVADAAYLPDGSAPLGLSAANEDLFKVPDGRLRGFAVYSPLGAADLSLVSPQGTVIEDDALYVEAQAQAGVLFTPTPAAVVLLSGALTEEATDAVGDADIAYAVLQMTPVQAQPLLKAAQFGSVGLKVSPAPRKPYAVAVPLRSTTLFYGPWSAVGAAGKVRFEQDNTLVPWNYGGYATMNAAATARVAESLANMQSAESGTLELAGLPSYSLGDIMQSGGPNITGLQVTYGTSGFTTNYSFQTFTPKFGVFSKGHSERLKRLGQATQELRRSLRAQSRDAVGALEAMGTARTARLFLQDGHPAAKKQTPHEALVGTVELETAPVSATQPGVQVAGTGRARVGISSATFEEAVALANADDSAVYQRTAVMSWQGLFRPFTTKPGGNDALPGLTPLGSGWADLHLSGSGLNPWRAANDVEICAYGDSYQGLSTRRGAEPANSRGFALRGPLVVSGWGYDTDGQPVPGSGGQFTDDWLNHSELWKVGPVDLAWDQFRGVWSSRDVLHGVVVVDVPADLTASGTLHVYNHGSGTGRNQTVWNWSGSEAVPSGTKVAALFDHVANRWYVQPPGSGGVAAEPFALPSGAEYTVYWNPPGSGGSPIWSSWPTLRGLTIQPTGANLGPFAMKTSAGSDSFRASASETPYGGGCHVIWPSGAPSASASGAVLSATSIVSGRAQLDWQATGPTQSVLMPLHVYCDGGNLVVQSGYLNFTNGWYQSKTFS